MKMIFLPYKKMIYFILIPVFIIIFCAFFYSISRLVLKKTQTIVTMSSSIKNYKILQVDTDGNEKKDTITIDIDEKNKEYKIEILNDENKKFLLFPNNELNIKAFYTQWWPLKITIADINKDNIPEIIIQLSRSTQAVSLYIFRWDGKKYTAFLSGSYEGIILEDLTQDKIPEIILEENIPGKGEKYNIFTWKQNCFSSINNYSYTAIKGYDKIKAIIKILSSPYEEEFYSKNYLKYYFSDKWIQSEKNIDSLKAFTNNIIGIQLEDYICDSIKDKNLYLWKLRYVVFRKYGTNIKIENYLINVETQLSTKNEYKISNFEFILE